MLFKRLLNRPFLPVHKIKTSLSFDLKAIFDLGHLIQSQRLRQHGSSIILASAGYPQRQYAHHCRNFVLWSCNMFGGLQCVRKVSE